MIIQIKLLKNNNSNKKNDNNEVCDKIFYVVKMSYI